MRKQHLFTRLQTKPISAKTAAIYLSKIVVLAVIYHLAARLGLKMAYVQINTSPVWPPTGIALATLLIFYLVTVLEEQEHWRTGSP